MFDRINIFFYEKKEYEKYKNYFEDHAVLKIVCGDIFKYKADVLITPGNSFSILDGGIDNTVNIFFDSIERRIQKRLLLKWKGELPIGVSEVFAINCNTYYKNLCYSPTMMHPCIVSKTINCYLAFRGALIECSKQRTIKTINCPLLCKGVGAMPIETILHQMKCAYKTFMKPVSRDWLDINDSLYEIHNSDMQYEKYTI